MSNNRPLILVGYLRESSVHCKVALLFRNPEMKCEE